MMTAQTTLHRLTATVSINAAAPLSQRPSAGTPWPDTR